MLSAVLVGYPVPQMINWQRRWSNEVGDEGGDEYGYLKGALRALEGFGWERDDDLVLLVSGYDVWFQLRPQVLIDRYRRIIKDANQRTRKDLGEGAPNITNSIIFAAQKECSEGVDDLGCYAAPESPLPTDIYGSNTDTEAAMSRPRYIQSEMAMGPLVEMREFLRHAVNKWRAKPDKFEDLQAVFADIYGEQEYRREVIRSQHMSQLQQLSSWFFKSQSILESHPLNIEKKDDICEYGLTLDYEGQLGKVTDYPDSDWILYADANSVVAAAKNVNANPVGGLMIQSDIESSRPPFFSLASIEKDLDLPREMAWENISLFSNAWTGVTPALIYHNTSNSDKASFGDSWKRLWFQPYARTLLRAHARAPSLPVASEMLSPRTEKAWWDIVQTTPIDKSNVGFGVTDHDQGGTGAWMKWTDICSEEHQKAVFADDGPKWEDPVEFPPFPDMHPEWAEEAKKKEEEEAEAARKKQEEEAEAAKKKTEEEEAEAAKKAAEEQQGDSNPNHWEDVSGTG